MTFHFRQPRPNSQRLHPTWCSCRDCERHRDPMRGHDRMIGQLQAGLLLAAFVAFYALALFFAPAIADSFGWGGASASPGDYLVSDAATPAERTN